MASETQIEVIELHPEIGIGEAEALRRAFLSALAEQRDIELDAAGVRRVGLAGLQVLAALSLELGRRGKVPVWRSVSQTLADAARVTGLMTLLGIGEVACAE